jgi:hypothetical protein
MKFIAIIPVKPYVKRFLENNYGDPVDFKNYPSDNLRLKRMLTKPCFSKDYCYPDNFSKLSIYVSVVISSADYYRYGWQLSKTDIVSFNKYYETQAKIFMRMIVGNYIAFGTPRNKAIFKFQSTYNMNEDVWPFESIVKDLSRFKSFYELDFKNFAYDHLEKLITSTLIDSHTLAPNFVRNTKFS